MITNREKMILHIYRDAACLHELEYRRLLLKHSGCESSADREFDRIHFRHVMAALEAILFQRVEDGVVPRPNDRVLGRRGPNYWRGELSRALPRGKITTSQIQRITELWDRLRDPLGARRTNEYFIGIVARATRKRDVGLTALTNTEAALVIDALQDILKRTIAAVQPGKAAP